MNKYFNLLAVLFVVFGTSACTDQKQFDAKVIEMAKTCEGIVSMALTKSDFGNSMTVTCQETKEQRVTSNALK